MKNKLMLNIAGFYIEVNFYQTKGGSVREKIEIEIKENYAGFIVLGEPKKIDFQIDFVQRKDLFTLYKRKEKKYYINFFEVKNKNHWLTFYQISPIQFQIIIRSVLLDLLSKNKGFILHASASKTNKTACLFTGRPGAGKSTAMSLLQKNFLPLADDTVIIKKEKNNYYLYQTPFTEKEAWVKKEAKKYLINRVFFLRKAKLFKTEKINDKEYILDRIIKQFWTEEKLAKKQLGYMMNFINGFNDFYFLYFAKDSQKLINLLTNEV